MVCVIVGHENPEGGATGNQVFSQRTHPLGRANRAKTGVDHESLAVRLD
jgi:hypothetical protein